MRTNLLLVAAALLAAGAARAADGAAATPAPAPAPSLTAAPGTPLEAATASGTRHAWVGTVGAGYYERLHVGVAYQLSPRAAVGVFGGSDLSLGSDSTWEVGLSYAHALRQVAGRFELGWDTKALYWDQSSADYDWKMLSLVAGAYVARDLTPAVSLALDGGVALSFSLDTVRKQNTSYEYPTRWNGSVCLELRYRFDRW